MAFFIHNVKIGVSLANYIIFILIFIAVIYFYIKEFIVVTFRNKVSFSQRNFKIKSVKKC